MTPLKDGRKLWPDGLVMLPTLRVCMQCGATWGAGPEHAFKIKHCGPHVKTPEYKRASLWPRR